MTALDGTTSSSRAPEARRAAQASLGSPHPAVVTGPSANGYGMRTAEALLARRLDDVAAGTAAVRRRCGGPRASEERSAVEPRITNEE